MRGYYGVTPWNDTTVGILKELWEQGQTATEISIKFGYMGYSITRNAVIGKTHRMSFKQPPRGNSPKAPRSQPRKRIVVPPSHPHASKYVKRGTKLPTAIKTIRLDPDNPGISIMELDRNKCAAIVRDGTTNTLATYCGLAVEEGKSFCPSHCAMFYVEPYARTRPAYRRQFTSKYR